MHLLVVRHGVAEERETWAPKDDGLRPLTDAGKKKMKEAPRGARAVPRIGCTGHQSSHPRAKQTATILAKAYDKGEPVLVDALAPGSVRPALLPWLRTQATQKTVAIVGHEPGLGSLVSWLTAGSERSFVELGKGGASLLDLGERIEAGDAMLFWLLRPSQLRSLA
jgi:phosphohistidine phosphatase